MVFMYLLNFVLHVHNIKQLWPYTTALDMGVF